MTRALFVAVFGAAVLSAGCGYEGQKMPEPVEITGTVTYADGRPVKDVQLTLRPRGEGHSAGCPLGADGTFTVKAVPGEFMFFFQPSEDPKLAGTTTTKFALIPPPYQDINVEHVVQLKAGGGNVIKLK